MSGVEVFAHPFTYSSRIKFGIPNCELINISVVVIISRSGSAEFKILYTIHSLCFACSGMPQRAVQVYFHAARSDIFCEGPVIPFSFVILRVGRFIYAVVACCAAVSCIPVYGAVAPGNMGIDHPVVQGVVSFEHHLILRLKKRVTVLP